MYTYAESRRLVDSGLLLLYCCEITRTIPFFGSYGDIHSSRTYLRKVLALTFARLAFVMERMMI